MQRSFLRLKSYSVRVRYAIALLCPLAAALITLRLSPNIHPSIFPLFFLSVIITAWFAGSKLGLLATAFAVGVVLYVTPHGLLDSTLAIRLVTFVLSSLLVCWLIGAFRKSLAAVREREEWFQEIFESSRDAIFLVNESAAFVECNEAACELTGYSREELLSMRIPNLHDEPDLEAFRSYFDSIMGGRDITSEAFLRRKDARKVLVEFSNRRMTFRGNVVMHTTARDVTERRRVEERLQESERQLAAAQQIAHLGSWEWDTVANEVNWSEELYRIFGLKPQEFGATYEAYLERVHPYDKEFVQDVIANSLRAGQPFDYDTRIARPDGVVRTIHAINEVVVDENGTVTKMMGTVQDVTERKRAEKAREQLLKERKELLSRLVKAQEDERRRIARELHDQLGQQITALMLGIKLLKDSGHCQPQATRHLDRLQEYADQLGRELHNIAWELRPTALDDLGLHTALGNYLEKWSESSGKTAELHCQGFNGHRLSTQIETTLYRVIQEALTNVIKHSEAEFVSLILERRDNHVLAIVEDDGRGFNVEEVMNASESEHKLGILGMRERLALVFGTLEIESTPGAGTSVFVRIPTPQIESEVGINEQITHSLS
ncbi:MAG TPA: PAS domain S-box protein [Pyrinomonadaceae bacterium]